MEKVVVLNSGGFDSTVLIHYVKNNYPDAEIHSLHFSYGQRSSEEELKWSEYNAKKVGAVIKNISLPPFDWTKSNFYKDGYEYKTQYLEWRNLVFISYAFSYSESVGADKIFVAFLLPPENIIYKDTSKKFLCALNILGEPIEIEAPFQEDSFYDLIPLAFSYGIEPNTFHSCDISNIPCGSCYDCKKIEVVNEELKVDTLLKAYAKNGNADNEEFKNILKNEPLEELRILWNNDCQLHCKHCFHGENDVYGERLSDEEFLKVIKEALDIGVSSIHFGGKEPLFDDSIISFIKKVNDLIMDKKDFELSLVTNGINLPLFASRLKQAGLTKVYVSADDIIGNNTSLYRNTSNEITFNAIKAAQENDLELEVFVDLHNKNCGRMLEILENLKNLGVKNIFIRTIRNIGNAKNNSLNYLTIKELESAFNLILAFSKKYIGINVCFTCGIYYVNLIYRSNSEILSWIDDILWNKNYRILENLKFIPEFFCSKYSWQVTLTSDGYILGCASDICNPDYWKDSGFIREKSLKQIIYEGRESKNCICNSLKHNPFCMYGCPNEFAI